METTQNTPGYIKTEHNGEKEKDFEYTLEVPLEKSVIARLIKALRNLKNYSQTTLGRMLGVQKTQISKLEKGKNNISLSTLVKIFSALKTRVSFSIKLEKQKDYLQLKDAMKKGVEEKT